MITIDGKELRSLEEQVLKNKQDIEYMLEEEGALNQFGIKVVGQVDTAAALPDPTTYTGEYGDAYAVSGGSNENNPSSIVIGTPTTFYLKDQETISIANLPYGVTYTVAENCNVYSC